MGQDWPKGNEPACGKAAFYLLSAGVGALLLPLVVVIAWVVS